jgi:hypothetical protein
VDGARWNAGRRSNRAQFLRNTRFFHLTPDENPPIGWGGSQFPAVSALEFPEGSGRCVMAFSLFVELWRILTGLYDYVVMGVEA